MRDIEDPSQIIACTIEITTTVTTINSSMTCRTLVGLRTAPNAAMNISIASLNGSIVVYAIRIILRFRIRFLSAMYRMFSRADICAMSLMIQRSRAAMVSQFIIQMNGNDEPIRRTVKLSRRSHAVCDVALASSSAEHGAMTKETRHAAVPRICLFFSYCNLV